MYTWNEWRKYWLQWTLKFSGETFYLFTEFCAWTDRMLSFFAFFHWKMKFEDVHQKKKLIIEYYWLNFNETSHFPFYLRHTFCLFQTVKVIIIIKLLLKQLDKSIFMLFTSLLPKKGYAVIHIPITSISIDSKFGMLYCSIR